MATVLKENNRTPLLSTLGNGFGVKPHVFSVKEFIKKIK
jgi:hypothetical protein